MLRSSAPVRLVVLMVALGFPAAAAAHSGEDGGDATSATFGSYRIEAGAISASAGLEFSGIVATIQRADAMSADPDVLWLQRVYLDALGRELEEAGAATFTDLLGRGATRNDVAVAILSSDEYFNVVVSSYYEEYLGREADPSGLNAFVALLNDGARDEDVIAVIVASDEYFAGRAGGTNEGFVNALYQDLLGRAADASGLATFVGLLSSQSRTQVATSILTSTEYRTRLIEGFYNDLLRREPDAEGVQAWVNFLSAGGTVEQVMGLMVASDEYYAMAAVPQLDVEIDWGDGETSAGSIEANELGGFDVVGEHTFANSGVFDVHVIVTDEDENIQTIDLAATVDDVVSTIVTSLCGSGAGFASPLGLMGIALMRGGRKGLQRRRALFSRRPLR